jgi:hypothetical protein
MGTRRPRHPDDAGGVWIATGVVLGMLLYALIVLMYVAGFTAVAPLVILPPVLIGLIGANSLLGGGRHGRRPAAPPPAAPGGSNGTHPRPDPTGLGPPPLGAASPTDPPGP